LAAGFSPKNLGFVRKMMDLPESGGGALARMPMCTKQNNAALLGASFRYQNFQNMTDQSETAKNVFRQILHWMHVDCHDFCE